MAATQRQHAHTHKLAFPVPHKSENWYAASEWESAAMQRLSRTLERPPDATFRVIHCVNIQMASNTNTNRLLTKIKQLPNYIEFFSSRAASCLTFFGGLFTVEHQHVVRLASNSSKTSSVAMAKLEKKSRIFEKSDAHTTCRT